MYCELTKVFVGSLIILAGDPKKVHGNNHFGLDYTEEEDNKEINKKFLTTKSEWPEPECWMNLKVKKLFDALDNLEENYEDVRQEVHAATEEGKLSDKMLKAIILNKGMAQKPSDSPEDHLSFLPAGINLGGYSTIQLNDSFIFFHHMRLRDRTPIRFNFLHNDIYNMVMTARIGLDDLILIGSYQRAIADDNDPFSLVYKPTEGYIELMLSEIRYKVEARYRLVHHRLHVEHITSQLTAGEMFITFYKNGGEAEPAERLDDRTIAAYLERTKVDMDVFFKGYLNNYLMLFNLSTYSNNTAELQNYDQEKTLILNEWVDQAVRQMRAKMHRLKVTSVKEPSYNIYSPDGMIFKLKAGVLRGLDSIHRRSVATCKTVSGITYVDAILGFSTLQLEYKYEAMVHIGDLPLTGLLVLNADDLTAHMSISMIQDPETIDLKFHFYKQARTEFLVISGSVNKQIQRFKHLLQNHILSLMTKSVLNTVAGLKYLTKCHSSGVLISHVDKGEIHLKDEADDHSKGDYKKETTKSIDFKDKATNKQDEIHSKIDFNTPTKNTEEMKTTTSSDLFIQDYKTLDPVKGTIAYDALKRRARDERRQI